MSHSITTSGQPVVRTRAKATGPTCGVNGAWCVQSGLFKLSRCHFFIAPFINIAIAKLYARVCDKQHSQGSYRIASMSQPINVYSTDM